MNFTASLSASPSSFLAAYTAVNRFVPPPSFTEYFLAAYTAVNKTNGQNCSADSFLAAYTAVNKSLE
ncbi:TPA: hypothetical protein L5T32_006246 [Pseudomonas aeruginosa]|nr:hypothetical protein [Pseudomonas aeruginosa]